ncbi:MAG TPA: hypothetical protein VIS48_08055 [Candidatus Kryptonia bacterium]
MGIKIHLLSIVLTVLSVSFGDPKAYFFRSKLAPNSTYNISMDIRSESTIKFVADNETLALLHNSGLKNPTKSSSVQKVEETIKSGNAGSDSSFFVRMTINKFDNVRRVNGVESSTGPGISMSGLEVTGIYTKENRLTNIRIEGGKLTEEMRTAIGTMAENALGNIRYPDKPMAIGDSFQQQMPMVIPIPGYSPARLEMVVSYKLTRVDGDTAYFDNTYTMKMDQEEHEYKMELSGGGAGTLKHDLRRNFFIADMSRMKMDAKVKTDKFEMDEKSDVQASVVYH